jgi:hypothetical protein
MKNNSKIMKDLGDNIAAGSICKLAVTLDTQKLVQTIKN